MTHMKYQSERQLGEPAEQKNHAHFGFYTGVCIMYAIDPNALEGQSSLKGTARQSLYGN